MDRELYDADILAWSEDQAGAAAGAGGRAPQCAPRLTVSALIQGWMDTYCLIQRCSRAAGLCLIKMLPAPHHSAPVAAAIVPVASPAAQKRTADALPVHSFRSLLSELTTFSRNTMAVANAPEDTFLLYPQMTPLQARVFELLGVAARP